MICSRFLLSVMIVWSIARTNFGLNVQNKRSTILSIVIQRGWLNQKPVLEKSAINVNRGTELNDLPYISERRKRCSRAGHLHTGAAVNSTSFLECNVICRRVRWRLSSRKRIWCVFGPSLIPSTKMRNMVQIDMGRFGASHPSDLLLLLSAKFLAVRNYRWGKKIASLKTHEAGKTLSSIWSKNECGGWVLLITAEGILYWLRYTLLGFCPFDVSRRSPNGPALKSPN